MMYVAWLTRDRGRYEKRYEEEEEKQEVREDE